MHREEGFRNGAHDITFFNLFSVFGHNEDIDHKTSQEIAQTIEGAIQIEELIDTENKLEESEDKDGKIAMFLYATVL
jgi:hypothetical protein